MDRKQQIAYLKSLKDEDIDFSDIPEVSDDTDWQPNPFFKPKKVAISARIDADVLMWLKTHDNYNAFINQICREKMYAERASK